MKQTRILGTVIAVALMLFGIAPVASPQTNVDILDGQWFKVKLSLKGYRIADDNETVLGKGAGSASAYLYFAYTEDIENHDASTYTIKTCMQDDMDDNTWYKNTSAPISIADIYGTTYPQVWDLKQISLTFSNGADTFTVYPTFYMKINANGSELKTATINNIVCTLFADLPGGADGKYATGSCSLSGPLVPLAKQGTIPADCRLDDGF